MRAVVRSRLTSEMLWEYSQYGWGDASLLHQDYMRWRGIRGSHPGLSDDPFDGFRYPQADLAGAAAPS